MFILFILLLCIVPIIELGVMIEVGSMIGLWPTIGLLVLGSLLGVVLVRIEGRAAWRRFQIAIVERRPPTREVFDGVAILFGGGLLLFPGFVTDFFGLLLLFPPTRAIVRWLLTWWFMRRTVYTAVTTWRENDVVDPKLLNRAKENDSSEDESERKSSD